MITVTSNGRMRCGGASEKRASAGCPARFALAALPAQPAGLVRDEVEPPRLEPPRRPRPALGAEAREPLAVDRDDVPILVDLLDADDVVTDGEAGARRIHQVDYNRIETEKPGLDGRGSRCSGNRAPEQRPQLRLVLRPEREQGFRDGGALRRGGGGRAPQR